MICYVDPIAHVPAIAINRERLVTDRFDDHEWNQFFRELIRAVIVRAPRHQHFLAVSSGGSEDKKIGAGFACRIWRARIEGRLLGEFAGGAERSIDFVGRNLNEPLDAVATRAVEQHAGTDDIGVNKIER